MMLDSGFVAMPARQSERCSSSDDPAAKIFGVKQTRRMLGTMTEQLTGRMQMTNTTNCAPIHAACAISNFLCYAQQFRSAA